jgi:hypothetical protein
MRIIPAFIHVPDNAGGNAVRNLLAFACDNETPITLDEDVPDRFLADDPDKEPLRVFTRAAFDALPEAGFTH